MDLTDSLVDFPESYADNRYYYRSPQRTALPKFVDNAYRTAQSVALNSDTAALVWENCRFYNTLKHGSMNCAELQETRNIKKDSLLNKFKTNIKNMFSSKNKSKNSNLWDKVSQEQLRILYAATQLGLSSAISEDYFWSKTIEEILLGTSSDSWVLLESAIDGKIIENLLKRMKDCSKSYIEMPCVFKTNLYILQKLCKHPRGVQIFTNYEGPLVIMSVINQLKLHNNLDIRLLPDNRIAQLSSDNSTILSSQIMQQDTPTISLSNSFQTEETKSQNSNVTITLTSQTIKSIKDCLNPNEKYKTDIPKNRYNNNRYKFRYSSVRNSKIPHMMRQPNQPLLQLWPKLKSSANLSKTTVLNNTPPNLQTNNSTPEEQNEEKIVSVETTKLQEIDSELDKTIQKAKELSECKDNDCNSQSPPTVCGSINSLAPIAEIHSEFQDTLPNNTTELNVSSSQSLQFHTEPKHCSTLELPKYTEKDQNPSKIMESENEYNNGNIDSLDQMAYNNVTNDKEKDAPVLNNIKDQKSEKPSFFQRLYTKIRSWAKNGVVINNQDNISNMAMENYGMQPHIENDPDLKSCSIDTRCIKLLFYLFFATCRYNPSNIKIWHSKGIEKYAISILTDDCTNIHGDDILKLCAISTIRLFMETLYNGNKDFEAIQNIVSIIYSELKQCKDNADVIEGCFSIIALAINKCNFKLVSFLESIDKTVWLNIYHLCQRHSFFPSLLNQGFNIICQVLAINPKIVRIFKKTDILSFLDLCSPLQYDYVTEQFIKNLINIKHVLLNKQIIIETRENYISSVLRDA